MPAEVLADSIQALSVVEQILLVTIAASNLGLFVSSEPPITSLAYTYYWTPAPRAEFYIVEVLRPAGEWTMVAATRDTAALILVRPPGREIVRTRGLNQHPVTGEIQEGPWSPESLGGRLICEAP